MYRVRQRNTNNIDQNKHKSWNYSDRSKECHDKFTRESAFRAINTQSQSVEANQSIKVYFDKEEFDLGHEYEPCPSTFEPRRDGVYLITATIGFTPESFRENYRARVEIRINGEPSEAVDNDFWGKGVINSNAVQVTAILQLAADDYVEIFMESTVPGTIPESLPGVGVNAFSAARLVDLR